MTQTLASGTPRVNECIFLLAEVRAPRSERLVVSRIMPILASFLAVNENIGGIAPVHAKVLLPKTHSTETRLSSAFNFNLSLVLFRLYMQTPYYLVLYMQTVFIK